MSKTMQIDAAAATLGIERGRRRTYVRHLVISNILIRRHHLHCTIWGCCDGVGVVSEGAPRLRLLESCTAGIVRVSLARERGSRTVMSFVSLFFQGSRTSGAIQAGVPAKEESTASCLAFSLSRSRPPLRLLPDQGNNRR